MNIALLELLLMYGVQIFLLWLLADFLTGMVHWWQDAYGNPAWPILGKYMVEPNLNHHKHPRDLLKGSYWTRIKASFVAAIILIILFYLCGWSSWQMILCLLFSSQGNEIHAMSHRTNKENGKFVIFLQRLGLIQGRKTHGWHHKAPYDTNFCVMTEFLNPVLSKIDLWKKMESFLHKFFGIKPLRGSPIREGV